MEGSRHQPVMLEESLGFLRPGPGRTFADLTLGGGGHSQAMLEAGATVVGFDRDPNALQRARARLMPHLDRFVPVHRDFASFGDGLDEVGCPQVDGVLMDLGLSSDQLDDPGRGFAFRLDGPLDLRFDPSRGEPAYARLAGAEPAEVEAWLREYGEVRIARRLARRLVEQARAGRLQSTADLRTLVEELVPQRNRPEGELARVFQALRILVNAELEQLERALDQMCDRLRPGGRLVVISYHSLEDRRVKRFLRHESGRDRVGSRHLPPSPLPEPRMRELTRRVVRPTEEEIARNPRARSARLRAGERR